MFTATGILLITLLPAGIATAILLIGLAVQRKPRTALSSTPARDQRSTGRGSWPGALAVAGAYVLSHIARFGVPTADSWQAVEAWQWTCYVALAAAVVIFLESQLSLGFARWGGRAILLALALWLWLQPWVAHTWTGLAAMAWLVALTVGGLIMWASIERLVYTTGVLPAGAIILVATTGTAVVVGLTGSQRLAELGGILTSSVTAASLVALSSGRIELLAGAGGVSCVAMLGLLIGGYFFAETPAAAAGLLAMSAPAAASMALLLTKQRVRSAFRAVSAVVTSVILVVAALLLCLPTASE